MKKLYAIFLFLFCISSVNAIDLSNKVIEFSDIDGYGMQGFSNNDKYLFVVLISNDEESSIIKVYDINTFKEYNTIHYSSLGHANDVTYNSKEDRFYVARSGGSSLIDAFDGTTLEYIDTIDVGYPIRSLTYIDELDKYAVRVVSTGYMMDSTFNIDSTPFVMGLGISPKIGRQGWTFYNGFLYYSNWSWIRYGGDGSNFIKVYNLDGYVIDKYYIEPGLGELENVSFNNNKMILGFNCYDGIVRFFVSDIPEVIVNYERIQVIEDDVEEVLEDEEHFSFIIPVILIIIIIILIYLCRRKMLRK